jgi:predicted MFS family arabinose efflux permease
MPATSNKLDYSELRQNWTLLPACLVGIMLCSLHGYSIGVMIPALESEFGWPRAQISGGMMIVAMIALFGAPLAGIAVDRFGSRRIALSGILIFCGALALLSTATIDVRSWWLLWALLAVGNMMILPTVWAKAINGRFNRNRGAALALALCGTGVASAFAPALTQWLVAHYGWRTAYVALAGMGAAITFPIAWFLFHPDDSRPAEMNKPVPVLTGYTVREGFRSPVFYKLAVAIWLFSVSICALTTNAYPVLLAQGLVPQTAAFTAGLMGIGSICGRLLGGVLLDRFDAAKVAAASVCFPCVTVVLLLLFPGSALAAAFACLVLGIAIGTEVDCCAYLAGHHLGLKSFGTLFGTMNGLMLFGNGIAPVLANHIYDLTKSYEIVLWAQIPACLTTAALFLILGKYPDFSSQHQVSLELAT